MVDRSARKDGTMKRKALDAHAWVELRYYLGEALLIYSFIPGGSGLRHKRATLSLDEILGKHRGHREYKEHETSVGGCG